ncbi:hypothetical protein CEUSTIGMA_g12509.t1 [Chlamydomonas eustigma]|uniref:Methyltransferase type 11 domain-containing protein n=1 Tax=Chlamydomonas eustigma TaxID=1157962 RepID=A0A250XQ66_9CHLO|nr:hypothetical protein CEUSTIGMA_g12509.t1 [Chlamydomonas eustigma]|eukprot:GAX85089.1 hypothetical protein CEUSTIGMA_g12509.t1 [Chlamydomonas eustigma]
MLCQIKPVSCQQGWFHQCTMNFPKHNAFKGRNREMKVYPNHVRTIMTKAIPELVDAIQEIATFRTPSMSSIALAAAALPLSGGLLYLFYLYTQLEYITASMLSRHVPRTDKGANVIQVGGGSKELYYYPKNTMQVTIVGDGINKSLLEQAGMQASVPTLARPQSPSDLSFAATSSVDAVVCGRAASKMSQDTRRRFFTETARILKPGCPLIFIERDSRSILKYFKENEIQWEQVEYDMALEQVKYAHVVGVAVKSKLYVPPPSAIKSSDTISGQQTARISTSAGKAMSKEDRPKNKGFAAR